MKPVIYFAVLALVFSFASAQALYLTRAQVIDGSGAAPYTATVLVDNGYIQSIDRSGGSPPAGVTVIDLNGDYLLPGFIDAHVHISDAAAARRALLSGVTTARSMGVANFADVGLARLVATGAAQGPELVAAGYHIRPRLAEAIFINEPSLADLLPGVSGPASYRRVAHTNLARGVGFLKVVATDRAGLPTTDPRRQIMSRQEIAAVVEEGEAQSVPVAAHAHGDAGGRAAVEAGVRSIEHGTFLEAETLMRMKELGTFLVPTVAVVRDLTEPDGDYDNVTLRIRGRHMLPRIQEMVRLAHQAGVRIVSATDTGYSARSLLRIQHDIQELVGCGLSEMEAIEAATSTASELLGIQDRTGRIVEGLEADLIVVDGNPLEEIYRLQDVLLVLSNGRVELDRITRR